MKAKNYKSFELKINMGNDSMLTISDLINSLKYVATGLDYGFRSNCIQDENGNVVGSYELTEN